MAITALPGAADISASGFPRLWHQYIGNSVRATLAVMPQDVALLADEVRDRALHVLSFALKIEEEWPTTRTLLLLLAPKLEQAGHRDDWLPYLEAGIQLSQRCDDTLAEAELRLQAGHLHYLCSRFALAEQQLNTSMTLFHALADTHGQARTHNELAWLDHLQHRYAEAADHVEQALALLDNEDPERAMSYRVQGMIAIDRRQWEEAEALHRQELALFEKQGDQRRIARSIQNLATALRGQKRFSEAIIYYEQAVKMLDQIADIHSLGVAQMNLGATYFYLNKSPEALMHHKQAEFIFNRLHDKLSVAKVNTGLGLGYLGLKEYKEAENAFLNSIRLFAELQDDNLRLNAIDGLVITYVASEQYDQAIKVAELALRELPHIINTPNYPYLVQSLNQHLVEAKQGQGLSIQVLPMAENPLQMEQSIPIVQRELIRARLEPATYANLIGVSEYIEQLQQLLIAPSPPWLVSIEGIGGIGKTSIADALLRQLIDRSIFEEIGWVSACETRLNTGGTLQSVEQPMITVATLIQQLLSQLLPNLALPVNTPVEKTLRVLQERLKEGRHLIVIDNLDTVADAEELLPILQTLANPTKFVLTSRKSLYADPNIYHFTVPELSEENALQLLKQEAMWSNLPVLATGQEAELLPIVQTVGGNPLALRLVLGQLHIHALETILAELRDAHGQTVENLYNFIYRHTWDSLDPLSQRVLLIMPLVSPYGVELEYLAEVGDISVGELRQALNKLIMLNLVITHEGLHDRRYSIHGLTRTFLQEQVAKWL